MWPHEVVFWYRGRVETLDAKYNLTLTPLYVATPTVQRELPRWLTYISCDSLVHEWYEFGVYLVRGHAGDQVLEGGHQVTVQPPLHVGGGHLVT